MKALSKYDESFQNRFFRELSQVLQRKNDERLEALFDEVNDDHKKLLISVWSDLINHLKEEKTISLEYIVDGWRELLFFLLLRK